jgi:rhomboid protease GluP
VLSEDFRENPGTLALIASWVLVFGLMVMVQWLHPVAIAQGPIPDPVPISTLTSHRFGDMTWLEVRHGQPWRLVTATFIHFALLFHLVFNALTLFMLGRLVEPWYRTGPFLAICMLIGGLGNLLGGAMRAGVALARPWLASQAATHHWPGLIERFLRGQGAVGLPVTVHSGGGSTILLGLCTLAAVVGWRSRTRIGSHLLKLMIIFLVLTALSGIVLSNLVDNYGHLGGAIVGLIIGLCDRPLFKLSERKWFRMLCATFAAIVAGTCFAAAAWHDRVETRYVRQHDEIVARELIAQGARNDLERLYGLYARLALRSPSIREPSLDAFSVRQLLGVPAGPAPSKATPEQMAQERGELEEILGRLERIPKNFWGDSVEADLASLRALGRAALGEPPSYQQFYDFLADLRPAVKAISADLARWDARRVELEKGASRPR